MKLSHKSSFSESSMRFVSKYLSILKNYDSLIRSKVLGLFKPFLFLTYCISKDLAKDYSDFLSPRKKEKEEKEWNIFSGKNDLSFNIGNYAIMILNRPITVSPERMSLLWNNACWRVTIDAGTDRWFNFVKQHSLVLPLPNCVTGDFDSIKPETLDFCKQQKEIIVEPTPEQDSTDFDKALKILLKTSPHKLNSFLAVLEHSGRLDHIFANLNTLSRTLLNGYLLSESAITWLLHPGSHRIHIPEYLRDPTEWCGILPFSSQTKVNTSGLKWNLNNSRIEFGGLLSSSGSYDCSPEVLLSTDGTVIWTMSYGKK